MSFKISIFVIFLFWDALILIEDYTIQCIKLKIHLEVTLKLDCNYCKITQFYSIVKMKDCCQHQVYSNL